MNQDKLRQLNNTMWDKFQAYKIACNQHLTSLYGQALIDKQNAAWLEYQSAANAYQLARREMGLNYILQTGKE